ncbi:MAG: metalloregulator ArsR/SmtB family transcription factor [bacterium]
MSRAKLTPDLLVMIADRFKVLAEPARLDILNTLRGGEQTVTQIVDATGLGQGNVSKHLQHLYSHGFVARRKEGLYVVYSLADTSVFRLCDIMCDRLTADATRRRRIVAS